MKNPLLDLEFLRKLDLTRNKETYAKIILLTWNEEPVEEIQGKITAGSVNIDGASAVRRTCSLTMVSPNVDINNTYWSLKNKFKLEVGVENKIDPQYPDIIWFKQGTYVFTSLNMNVQSNNFTISLNGKDKMCLLNGEVGGSINASTDFGKIEEYETKGKEIVRNIIDIPIPDIIKNAIHAYAGEPLSNIILNDVENYGLELLEYRGDENHPLYMPRRVDTGEVTNMIINGKPDFYILSEDGEYDEIDITNKDEMTYYDRTQTTDNESATSVYAKDNNNNWIKYNIIKINTGETAGYRRTALIYPGELVANVGESLVSVLDKIKNMFPDFEYFYDLDGRFVFQKKKIYMNTSFDNLKISDNEIYAEDAKYTSSVVYSFEEGVLLSAFTNTPQILNIRNDFSIWGKRKATNGTDLPVHMRYAIDFKPKSYRVLRFQYIEAEVNKKTYQPNKYYIKDEETGEYILSTSTKYNENKTYYKEGDKQDLKAKIFTSDEYDWRELIYQMALDYFKYNHTKDNFTQLIAAANPEEYPTGLTGYEPYYTDMQGFWRQLYNPSVIDEEAEEKWVEEDIVKGVSTGLFSSKTGFNKNVTEHPEVLNFWFDFMDTNGEFGKYVISAIGNRPKAINDDKVNAIFFQETPPVLLLTQDDYNNLIANKEDYDDMTGYTFIQLLPQMENYFTISGQGKSAKDELDNLLYQYTCMSESVNLTAIPIYYLQPNVRILVKDSNTGINGEYIVSKITVPLQYNGTTAITATKAVERIY